MIWKSLAIIFVAVTLLDLVTVYVSPSVQRFFSSKSIQTSLNIEPDEKLIQLNETLRSLNAELRNIKFKSMSFTLAPAAVKQALHHPRNEHLKIIQEVILPESKKRKQALIFTMDSIESYEKSSRHGGAAGEILIRRSLETVLKEEFNFRVDTLRSDAEFDRANGSRYDIIILDPWTWAAKGWIPKKTIQGLEDRLYLLDFFGSPSIRGQLSIPVQTRVLTAFGSQWNIFLGYYIYEKSTFSSSAVRGENRSEVGGNDFTLTTKKRQGVIWGKDVKHYEGRDKILNAVAEKVTLVSTSTNPVTNHRNIVWRGHQTASSWSKLLMESKFLLGLGHPLLGPSAIDAISAGCVYINPRYKQPLREVFTSQHPYAAEKIGHPYVCSYDEGNLSQLNRCIQHALSTDLPPLVPVDFRRDNYVQRVKTIFNL